MNYVLLDTNDNAFEVWYEYSTFHFDLPKKKTWLQWAILGFLMTETLVIFFSETTSSNVL
jgi:hypothetical protein